MDQEDQLPKPLSIKELMEGELSRETIEEAAKNAYKAQQLLENTYFTWWRERLDGYLKKQYTSLALGDHKDEIIREFRGRIQSLEKVLTELDLMAQNLPRLQERLRELDDRRKDSETGRVRPY